MSLKYFDFIFFVFSEVKGTDIRMKICNEHISSIVKSGLCTGCGICEAVCPQKVFEVINSQAVCVNETICIDCELCKKCCPSYGYELNNLYKNYYGIYEAKSLKKYIYENSTSGGFITQFLCNVLDNGFVDKVAVVTKCESLEEGFCKYVLTDRKEDIIKASGSNYVQASISKLLIELKECVCRVAIVALPCQLYGISQAMGFNSTLRKNIVLKIGVLCGYTYNYNCIEGLCAVMRCKSDEIEKVIGWRENGIPGYFTIEKKNGQVKRIPFIDEHSIDVTFYAHEKCLLCKDCFSDYADIVAGDIGRGWKDKKTLVLTRTKKGADLIEHLNVDLEIIPLGIGQWKQTPLSFMELEKRSKVSERIRCKKDKSESIPIWTGDYNEKELPYIKKIYTRWIQKKQNQARKQRNLFLSKPEEMLEVGRELYYKKETGAIRYFYLMERAFCIALKTNWIAFLSGNIRKRERVYKDVDRLINVSVIGLGQWGRQYLQLLQRHRGYHIVSIYDQDKENCKKFVEKFGLEIQEPDEILQDKRVDTVFILTPNHLHYEMIRDAFFNKKNVFVEKPLTNEYGQSKALCDMANINKCYLYVGHSMKFNRGFFMLKELIQEEKLGKIRQFSCVRSLKGLDESIRMSWRADANLAPLLPLIQLGIHLIDATLYFFSDLKCLNVYTHETCGLVDGVVCVLQSGDIYGSLLTCYDTENTMEYVIYGSKGKAILNEDELILWKNGKKKILQRNLKKTNALNAELDDYYAWRKLKKEPINTSERALSTVKIFDEIKNMAKK